MHTLGNTALNTYYNYKFNKPFPIKTVSLLGTPDPKKFQKERLQNLENIMILLIQVANVFIFLF